MARGQSEIPKARKPHKGKGVKRDPGKPPPRDIEIYNKVASGGRTYAEIGEEYGNLTAGRISQIVRRVDEYIFPQLVDDIRKIKIEQTGELQHVYREAMDAWERSKQDEVTVRDGFTPMGTTKITTKKGQVGNPAFLNVAMKAKEDIRKIWGADAPLRTENIHDIRVAGQTREEWSEQVMKRIEVIACPSS